MSLSANYPALDTTFFLDFANSKQVDPRITVSRASTATYFDSTGTLATAGVNAPRIDFNPTTYACNGLLIEEQRTNSIRNNTMVGAVAGTPGTAPTNWAATTTAGITRELVGVGVENGVTYIDYRFSGTATGNNDTQFEGGSVIAAVSGQLWTTSAFVKLQAGSLANVTVTQILAENNSAGSFLAASTQNITPTTSAIGQQRQALTRTLNNASAAYVTTTLRVATAGAVDVTLRIGLPQLELGAFATSVIPTSTTAVTRSADAMSLTGSAFTAWYNATEGTLYAQGNLISSSYGGGVLADIGAGGVFGTTEYIAWGGTTWTLNPNVAPINVSSSVTTSSTAKIAIGIKANDSVISANSLIGTTDVSCAVAASPTTLSVGKGGWSGAGNYFNGWIQRICYYPLRNTNSQLQALTG